MIQRHFNDPHRVKDFADLAMKSYRAVIGIVNDILDMAKISEGKLTLSPEPASLVYLVEHVCSDFRLIAEHKGISLCSSIDESVGHQYRMFDELRLGQVLRNLISNAVKYTETGRIDVNVEAGQLQDWIRITVKDSGIGIPEDKLTLIFEAFEQAGVSKVAERNGTGLGLSISKHLVSLMEGDIKALSVVGEGTTFIVNIKLPVAPRSARSKLVAPQSFTKPVRVLLVEDSVTNQVVFKGLLQEHVHHIDVAENGRKGVELALQEPYDVIFMDINMPVMTGMEAISLLKEAGYQQSVVACTANVFKEDIESYVAAGFDGVVGKPYLLNDLIIHIQASLDVA